MLIKYNTFCIMLYQFYLNKLHLSDKWVTICNNYYLQNGVNLSHIFNEKIKEVKSDSFCSQISCCFEPFSSGFSVLLDVSGSNRILLCRTFSFLASVAFSDPAIFSLSYKEGLILNCASSSSVSIELVKS